ncbi:hypothetical protein B566_EDAN005202 [Ephemera danica]|nr:hypothetical protein B566_EDAN005202 [Ephemera danica]
MTDLLQQFAVGNELSDFNQLPSTAVTEVLMLEMKMAPAAKVYLISGFPRSMRDMAEYSDKIQVLSGAVLLSWRQKVLTRQVEYGAKLGHVVLSLATMELRNFYRSVDGERNPEEVYRDFRDTVQQLISPENKMHMNKVKPQVTAHAVIESPPMHHAHNGLSPGVPKRTPAVTPHDAYPPAIFIIGGPGSNKTSLCQRALRRHPGWGLVSLGRQLRAAAGAGGGGGGGGKGSLQQQAALRANIAAGEMAAQSVVLSLLEEQMSVQSGARGLLVAGFPRDLQQLRAFESKYRQRPGAILLDCSKLQLGRGRLDDSVAAFRRRLELFRELTLPLLKRLDQQGRLSIVDGDTDSSAVLEDFCSVLAGIMTRAEAGESSGGPPGAALGAGAEYLPATAGPHHQVRGWERHRDL